SVLFRKSNARLDRSLAGRLVSGSDRRFGSGALAANAPREIVFGVFDPRGPGTAGNDTTFVPDHKERDLKTRPAILESRGPLGEPIGRHLENEIHLVGQPYGDLGAIALFDDHDPLVASQARGKRFD